VNIYRQDRSTREQALFEGEDADKEVAKIAAALEIDARDVQTFLADGMTLPSKRYLWKAAK
jgi:hypothetical protein